MLFCQRILPSAVSRLRRLLSLPSVLAVCRKRCLPQTIGLELPAPGSATFQSMFLSGPNVSGIFLSSDVPDPFGPRKRSQTAVFDVGVAPARTLTERRTRLAT